MQNFTQMYLGKRVLYYEGHYWRSIIEGKIIEVSPSGEFIKIEDRSGKALWCNRIEITIKEILPE